MNVYGDAYRRRRTHKARPYRFVTRTEETREEKINRYYEYFLMVITTVGITVVYVILGYLWFMGVI